MLQNGIVVPSYVSVSHELLDLARPPSLEPTCTVALRSDVALLINKHVP